MPSFRQSSADLDDARDSLNRELERLSPMTAEYLLARIDRFVEAKIGKAFEQFSDGMKVAAKSL